MLNPKRYIIFFLFLFCFYNCNDKPYLTTEEKQYLTNNPDLVVAVYINYPPYEFINKNGKIDGILLDYFDKIENNIGHSFKKEFYSNWQSLIEDSKQQKIDIILEIQNTKERQEYLSFTEPIFKGKHSIITKNNSQDVTIAQLSGKRVAVGEHFSIEEYLKVNHPEIVLVPKANEIESIKALLNNEVDAFIGLESIANYIIKKEDHSNLKIQGNINYENELSIAIAKNKPLLTDIINKGNNAITLEEKTEILNKWLYDIVKPFHKKATFWEILLAVVGFVLLISTLFNYYLNKKVDLRTKDLVKAKETAEKNNQLKTLFLQNISHEVRTPLNSIIGFASFLKENKIEKEDKTEFVDTIVQQSSNLTNILNNIIEVSELTTTKTKPKHQQLCLEKELNILAEIYKAKAKHKNLDFKFNNSIKRSESFINSDKSRLTKAISNVLENAIKFTKEGVITLSSAIKNNKVIIQITDTGIGIKSEKSKVIFDEFYQVEKELSKKYDGLGIGLTIARENIKSLNGSLNLDSSDEKGTSFTITLSYNPVSSEAKTDNTPKLLDAKLKILIAEDMKLNYLVLQKMLDKIILDDKEIIWAKNGQEALDLVKDNNFDIIFMDIKMPVLDGYQATKQIKSLYQEIPVIAQTAYTHEEDYNKAMSIGFDGYLTKPINSNALKIALQDLFVIKITSD